jgi:hypothetical protein
MGVSETVMTLEEKDICAHFQPNQPNMTTKKRAAIYALISKPALAPSGRYDDKRSTEMCWPSFSVYAAERKVKMIREYIDRSNSPGIWWLRKYLQKTCVVINNESNTIIATEIRPIADRILSTALSITFNTIFITYFSEPYFFICQHQIFSLAGCRSQKPPARPINLSNSVQYV